MTPMLLLQCQIRHTLTAKSSRIRQQDLPRSRSSVKMALWEKFGVLAMRLGVDPPLLDHCAGSDRISGRIDLSNS